jgi:hypothetical protein
MNKPKLLKKKKEMLIHTLTNNSALDQNELLYSYNLRVHLSGWIAPDDNNARPQFANPKYFFDKSYSISFSPEDLTE